MISLFWNIIGVPNISSMGTGKETSCPRTGSDWFFSGKSNYKTKNTDDKLVDMCCASMVLVTLLVHIFVICAFNLM